MIIRFIILLIFIIILYFLLKLKSHEGFLVIGYNDDIQYDKVDNDPINNPQVQDSLTTNTYINYKTAYYYEFDNKAYQNALDNTFKNYMYKNKYNLKDWTESTKSVGMTNTDIKITAANETISVLNPKTYNDPIFTNSCDSKSVDLRNVKITSVSNKKAFDSKKYENPVANTSIKITDDDSINAYNSALNQFKNILNEGDTMLLPDGKKIEIQIVHDVLIHARKHIKLPDLYSFDIEVILYRESKYQGKHVAFRCVYNNKNNSFYIVNINILGEIAEDKIGLYPVFPINPYEINQLSAYSTTYPTIIDAEEYSQVADKSNVKHWEVTNYDEKTIKLLTDKANLKLRGLKTQAVLGDYSANNI